MQRWSAYLRKAIEEKRGKFVQNVKKHLSQQVMACCRSHQSSWWASKSSIYFEYCLCQLSRIWIGKFSTLLQKPGTTWLYSRFIFWASQWLPAEWSRCEWVNLNWNFLIKVFLLLQATDIGCKGNLLLNRMVGSHVIVVPPLQYKSGLKQMMEKLAEKL